MQYQKVELQRDVEVIIIPQGSSGTLTKGITVAITQSLGDSYTIQVADGQMYRVEVKDADALGIKQEAILKNDLVSSTTEEEIYNVLRRIYDPEIPVNVVDLGLIYALEVKKMADGYASVLVKMTLTAPACGMGKIIAGDVKTKILAIPMIVDVIVELVWDPPWHRGLMSEAAHLILGM